MIPIYEQGVGEGRGLQVSDFRRRFSKICEGHLKANRAKAFAFIFYDFTNSAIRSVLKHEGAFEKLDGLAGQSLSVFFLHANTEHAAQEFNSAFLATLGIAEGASLPCVVFFRLKDGQFDDIVVAQLDRADIVMAFHEIYEIIEGYIKELPLSNTTRFVKLIKAAPKTVASHLFDVALEKLLEGIF